MSDKDSLQDNGPAPSFERSEEPAQTVPASAEPQPEPVAVEAPADGEIQLGVELRPAVESIASGAPEPEVEELQRRPLLERMGVLPEPDGPGGRDQPVQDTADGNDRPEPCAEPRLDSAIEAAERSGGDQEAAPSMLQERAVTTLLAVAASAAEEARRHASEPPPRTPTAFAPSVTWPTVQADAQSETQPAPAPAGQNAPHYPDDPIETPVAEPSIPETSREEGLGLAIPQRPWLQRAWSFAVRAVAVYAAVLVFLVAVFRFVDPPGSALMALRWLGGVNVEQDWVPIDTISPHLVRAVVVSEDWTFCSHRGIDLAAMQQAIEKAKGGIPRGASTISMQVAKNMFLWPSKSYVRKAIEVPLTLVMELLWPKRRILEVYLNVAEWGPGVFGAEAAARHHFQKPASSLTAREAAQLAASLPNPIRRDAGDPGTGTSRKASVVQARMRIAGAAAGCVLAPQGVAATQKQKQ